MCGLTQRVGTSIAVLFHDRGRKRLSGQQHAAAALYPRENPVLIVKERVGPRALLDGRNVSSLPGLDRGP